MLILGLILLLIGIFAHISILTTIGVILLVIGAILFVAGSVGRPVGVAATGTDACLPAQPPAPVGGCAALRAGTAAARPVPPAPGGPDPAPPTTPTTAYPPVTPASGPRTTRSPEGSTWTLPGTTGKLGSAPGTRRSQARAGGSSALSRTPIRSLSGRTSQPPSRSGPPSSSSPYGPGTSPRSAGPRRRRDDRLVVRLTRHLVPDGQLDAGGERGRPEPPTGVPGPAPQDQGHGETAADGDVRAQTAPRGAEPQHGSGPDDERDLRDLVTPADLDRARRARHSDDEVVLRRHGEPADRHLQPRRSRPVADQALGARVSRTVERPRRRHPLPLAAGPAQVLHHGRRPRLQHPQPAHGVRPGATGTKRTRSPGASSAGGSRSMSKIVASVRPSRCHPPGELCG